MSPKLVKRPVYLTCCNHALPVTVILFDLLVGLFLPVFYFAFRLVCRREEGMSPKLVKRPVYPTCCDHALPVTITLSVGWFICSCTLFVFPLVCRRTEAMSPKLAKRPVYLTCCNHALPVTVILLDLLVGLFLPVFYLGFDSSVVGYRQCPQN